MNELKSITADEIEKALRALRKAERMKLHFFMSPWFYESVKDGKFPGYKISCFCGKEYFLGREVVIVPEMPKYSENVCAVVENEPVKLPWRDEESAGFC